MTSLKLRVFLISIGFLIACWMIVPTLIVIPLSFSGERSFAFPPKTWGLDNYVTFFTSPRWIDSLMMSVQLAVVVTIVSTVLGTLAALGLHRMRPRTRAGIEGAVLAPMIVPAIAVAVAVYITFLSWGLVGTLPGFVAAHTVLALPFVVVNVLAALAGLSPNLWRASAGLGASPLRTFFSVTLPLIRSGVLAGALFAFMTSFDEVVVSLFLRAPAFQTLPVQMFTSVSNELDPTIAAASTVVLVASTAILALAQLVRKRSRS